MSIEQEFVKQLAEIHERYRELAATYTSFEKSNGEPNIFEILGIENKEVLICRLLGDLLNPNGKINGGNEEPLKLFLKDVLGSKCTLDENDFSGVEILLEDVTDKNRRVDVVIKTDTNIYPIEVKIWAEDQPSQLYDYYRFYFGEKTDERIYYLTPTGKEPSPGSVGGLGKENYASVSFERDILLWLDSFSLARFSETAQFIIAQFKEVIQKMTQDAKIKEALKHALGYTKEKGYEYNELLLTILDHHEWIERSIQQAYIRRHCDLNPNVLSDELTKEDKKKDPHCVLKVLDDIGNTVAWICIATNLYIVTRNIKENAPVDKCGKNGWDNSKSENDYCWRYLYYAESDKLLDLKNIKDYLNKEETIAIEDTLKECE